MSLFHPLKKQHAALMKAFRDREYMTLAEAARVMGIHEESVGPSLAKMEAKGMFTGEVPLIDQNTGLVLRSRNRSGFTKVEGMLEKVISQTESMRGQIALYERHQQEQQRVDKAVNVGKAVLKFAGNALGGMKTLENLSQSTQKYRDEQEQDSNRKVDMRLMLEGIEQNSRRLLDMIRHHPQSSYPEEISSFLTALYTALVKWSSAMTYTSSSSAWDLVENHTREISGYAARFQELFVLADKAEKANKPASEVQETIRQTRLYLQGILYSIGNSRARAAVSNLMEQLSQLDQAYANAAEENINESDARSLKNIYLPMLQSIMEKYMKYERDGGDEGGKYSVEETLGVLEDELPRALTSMQNDLMKRRTSSMEDEATALRQKLSLDGLI